MPFNEKCRRAIPLSEPASNSETDSSSTNHLNNFRIILKSINWDGRCTDHMSEVSPGRVGGREEP